MQPDPERGDLFSETLHYAVARGLDVAMARTQAVARIDPLVILIELFTIGIKNPFPLTGLVLRIGCDLGGPALRRGRERRRGLNILVCRRIIRRNGLYICRLGERWSCEGRDEEK